MHDILHFSPIQPKHDSDLPRLGFGALAQRVRRTWPVLVGKGRIIGRLEDFMKENKMKIFKKLVDLTFWTIGFSTIFFFS